MQNTTYKNKSISLAGDSTDSNKDDGFFTLSCSRAACTANLLVASTDSEYLLSPAGTPLTDEGDGIYELSQISLSPEKKSKAVNMNDKSHSMQMLRGEMSIDTNKVEQSLSLSATTVDQDLIFDVLIMYTREALASYGGR